MSAPISSLTDLEVQSELESLSKKHKYTRPSRSTIDSSRPWRFGIPNYDRADLAFFRGRSRNHEKSSAEALIEDAVKTWEMEASHLPFHAWRSVIQEKYRTRANGGKMFAGEESAEQGNYNWLMSDVKKELYDAEKESFESSHELFRGAFKEGFPWEVLKVYGGVSEKVGFSWRHWGTFTGKFQGREGDGEVYEMFGWAVLDLEGVKVTGIEIYYDPEMFLKALRGDVDLKELRNGRGLLGGACPVNGDKTASGCPFSKSE